MCSSDLDAHPLYSTKYWGEIERSQVHGNPFALEERNGMGVGIPRRATAAGSLYTSESERTDIICLSDAASPTEKSKKEGYQETG